MHVWYAFSHLAVSSPRRVVPMRQESRLDEQDEKSGWRSDRATHWALATVVIAIRAAAIAAARVIFGMVRAPRNSRVHAVFHGAHHGVCGVKPASKAFAWRRWRLAAVSGTPPP